MRAASLLRASLRGQLVESRSPSHPPQSGLPDLLADTSVDATMLMGRTKLGQNAESGDCATFLVRFCC